MFVRLLFFRKERDFLKNYEIDYLPETVQGFLSYQSAVLNKSELTVLEYASDLRTFFRWLVRSKDDPKNRKDLADYDIRGVDIDVISALSLGDLYAFLAFCQRELKNSPKTRARKASALRSYFKFLKSHALIEKNPAEDLGLPGTKKALPKYLTLDQSIDLLDAIDGKFFERDFCIITFFLNCGLRLSELVGLNLRSIRPDGSVIVLGKGNKERIVYLNDACADALNKYLKVRPSEGLKDREALFISRHKNRISPKTVQHIVKKFLDKAGITEPGFSVHKLRHTAATLMYQHGQVDVMLLKELLGHESLATTQIYTHVANEQIKSAIESNPLSRVKAKEKKSEQ